MSRPCPLQQNRKKTLCIFKLNLIYLSNCFSHNEDWHAQFWSRSDVRRTFHGYVFGRYLNHILDIPFRHTTDVLWTSEYPKEHPSDFHRTKLCFMECVSNSQSYNFKFNLFDPWRLFIGSRQSTSCPASHMLWCIQAFY